MTELELRLSGIENSLSSHDSRLQELRDLIESNAENNRKLQKEVDELNSQLVSFKIETSNQIFDLTNQMMELNNLYGDLASKLQ
ncbi:hypothetical protein [Escherichia phage PJNS034]